MPSTITTYIDSGICEIQSRYNIVVVVVIYEKFVSIIEIRYPLLYEASPIPFTELDDWLEDIFPEVRRMCDDIRFYNFLNPVRFGIIQIAILEWLMYNPDMIEWGLL